ncbi:hypothetical protein VKT23_011984 [Stygiomarasmius scandens]|uniref:Uncharacterized protein n=1 Tax=Marasmiellus scandens TaxID=2682957 RepID=A0ABR1J8A3_9AGAR
MGGEATPDKITGVDVGAFREVLIRAGHCVLGKTKCKFQSSVTDREKSSFSEQDSQDGVAIETQQTAQEGMLHGFKLFEQLIIDINRHLATKI